MNTYYRVINDTPVSFETTRLEMKRRPAYKDALKNISVS